MEKRTLNELGEFGLIETITKDLVLTQDTTIKGVGDDAAVIDSGERYQLLGTDMLVEGVHFDLRYVPLKHLGYKAVVVNLSDIYAMNGRPEQITVSIALSSRFTLEAIEELYEGIRLACKIYNVDLVGGDTSTSISGLMISISALGTVAKDKVCYRDGANVGDLIVASGDFGGAYMGLQLLEREKAVFLATKGVGVQPELTGFDYILERQLKPEARKDVIDQLTDLKIQPTSMIDVSDGLASECIHIARQSDVGITLYEEKIPIDPMTYETAREFGLDPTTCTMNGGEDYELLFTIKQDDYEKIAANMLLKVIGHCTEKEEGYKLVLKDSSVHPFTAQGWDTFLKAD
ncbi:MAG: thiamine-monophosphate kinase [Patiriisocius sp.]|jgi:thiamine-monophosphate kinase